MRAINDCLELHRRRPVRFLKDPGGMVIAGFSWSIMIVSLCALWLSLSFWLGIGTIWGIIEGVVLTASVGMCMWTHYMVMTTEPGFVPMKRKSNNTVQPNADVVGGTHEEDDESAESDEYEEEEDVEMPLDEFENLEDDGSLLVFCDDCNMYRPTRAIHCDTCERCVVLMDHHCPWVNNCVGISNQKYFLLFLFYVAVSSVHVLILILVQRWKCTGGVAFCGFESGQFPGRLGVWLLAASCVFGLFCSAMLGMEIHAIHDDPIYSDIAQRLNVRDGCKSTSRLERHLSVIFGTNGFASTWLFPMPQRRNRHNWEIIGGFSPRADADGMC